jgi:hypothetical protein
MRGHKALVLLGSSFMPAAPWLPGCLAAWLPGCLAAWLSVAVCNPQGNRWNPPKARTLPAIGRARACGDPPPAPPAAPPPLSPDQLVLCRGVVLQTLAACAPCTSVIKLLPPLPAPRAAVAAAPPPAANGLPHGDGSGISTSDGGASGGGSAGDGARAHPAPPPALLVLSQTTLSIEGGVLAGAGAWGACAPGRCFPRPLLQIAFPLCGAPPASPQQRTWGPAPRCLPFHPEPASILARGPGPNPMQTPRRCWALRAARRRTPSPTPPSSPPPRWRPSRGRARAPAGVPRLSAAAAASGRWARRPRGIRRRWTVVEGRQVQWRGGAQPVAAMARAFHA